MVGTWPNVTQTLALEVSTPQTVNFPSGFTINNIGATSIYLRNRPVTKPVVTVTGSGATRRQTLTSTLLPSRKNNIKSLVVSGAGATRTAEMILDITNTHAYQNGSLLYMTGWDGATAILNAQVFTLSNSVLLGNGDNEVTFTALTANLPTNGTYLPTAPSTVFPALLISTGVDNNNTTNVPASNFSVTGSDPNMTIYSVSLQASVYTGAGANGMYNFSSDEVYVQWIPELFDLGTLVPSSASPSQVESDYYYLYSYNHWVVLLNETLQRAYTQLQQVITSVTTTSTFVLQNRVPTFEYDEVTKLFSLYTDTTNTNWGLTQGPPNYATLGPSGSGVLPTSGAGAEFMFLGYNLNFEGLMTNFDTQFFGQDEVVWGNGWNNPNGIGARSSYVLYQPENTIIVRNKTGTNIQNMINPATGLPFSTAKLNYVSTQDFPSTNSLWSPIGAIVLTTQLLPIRSEFTSAPVSLGASSSREGTSAFQTVLIDFNEDFETADGYRGLMKFNPTAEFIRVNMTQSHQEIKTLDFQVNWRNRLTNQLIPLRIYNTASITVRLLFRRRG